MVTLPVIGLSDMLVINRTCLPSCTLLYNHPQHKIVHLLQLDSTLWPVLEDPSLRRPPITAICDTSTILEMVDRHSTENHLRQQQSHHLNTSDYQDLHRHHSGLLRALLLQHQRLRANQDGCAGNSLPVKDLSSDLLLWYHLQLHAVLQWHRLRQP